MELTDLLALALKYDRWANNPSGWGHDEHHTIARALRLLRRVEAGAEGIEVTRSGTHVGTLRSCDHCAALLKESEEEKR